MILKVKKVNPEAIIPKYQTRGSAGFDVHSVEECIIKPGEQKIVKIGLALELEEGYELQIRPRSGLAAKHSITITNSPGTLDMDYRGELMVMLFNMGKNDFEIKKGDRIAQCVVSIIPKVEIVEVDSLSETERGSGGFGSTGK